MKLFLLIVACVGGWILSSIQLPSGAQSVLIIGGDTHGYLSPCGCTKPMSGGIRRRIALMKQLAAGKPSAMVENGGLIAGNGAQDQLKARAISEALVLAGFDAVNLGLAESRLGDGGFLSILNLLGDKALSSTLPENGKFPISNLIQKGRFSIAGLDSRSDLAAKNLGETSRNPSIAIDELIEATSDPGSISLLLFQGTFDEAKRLPRIGEIDVVVYRSTGAPADSPATIGSTMFVSPGEKGKHVIAMAFNGDRFAKYEDYPLMPDIADDSTTSRVYSGYLQQVESDRLLDAVPRTGNAKFSGSATCGSCHSKALAVWKKSKHFAALKTLEQDKHGRDPDCVGCHVVGLSVKGGFRSRASTPQLAAVGCESCHGAGANHSKKPLTFKMGKVGAKSCAPCHVPDHSPGFDFKLYWPKIKH